MANRRRDPEKEQFWRRMMARQRQSGGTVRAFCEREGLSQPSFYQWRRELVRRDRALARSLPRPAFVPLQIVPEAAVIEIVVGRGVVVRVPRGVDGVTLRQVLAALAGKDLAGNDDGTEAASC